MATDSTSPALKAACLGMGATLCVLLGIGLSQMFMHEACDIEAWSKVREFQEQAVGLGLATWETPDGGFWSNGARGFRWKAKP